MTGRDWTADRLGRLDASLRRARADNRAQLIAQASDQADARDASQRAELRFIEIEAYCDQLRAEIDGLRSDVYVLRGECETCRRDVAALVDMVSWMTERGAT